MKQHYFLSHFKSSLIPALLLLVTCSLSSCFLKQDRTTTVYGTITDQNGKPVDSIMVILTGLKFNNGTVLKEVYSDKDGNFELVADLPKKYSAINVEVPFLPHKNSKFQNNYNGFKIEKDGVPTNNCCTASIGEKTKYDFQLIPK
ncbi:carboxypeptidase-like regulatory domain-containing protein [Dyadobacter chenhuakuii]|uniref:Carboxypeptidase-like regulatory domain-containing protein n=1 Tax=Dyadobacter chenhuakuii TaxID=2909339 RepID=A0ABY4XGW1_9BACT|nr:carboxypeptidase-like regulatory domain-containing protein [Dyadobacter chenhuakuii]MCF2495588.1 carboxypeptidase-like regulatory domain-containing protein [Dyadobacter chenhuakuii]USJ29623.1 carboxypeptidase-like regulatory domain-containing protein [Dyadobacter chenhuakuii]